MLLRWPGNVISVLIQSKPLVIFIKPVSHGYLLVCLFSLVWVVSLFLPSLSPPPTYSTVCFWFSMGANLIGYFLFVDYNWWCWIILQLYFGWNLDFTLVGQLQMILIGFDLNWTFVLAFSSLSSWMVAQMVILVILLGFILMPLFGDFKQPVDTRRNGRFLAIWTHPRGRARPLPCSSSTYSCSSRTRGLSSSFH